MIVPDPTGKRVDTVENYVLKNLKAYERNSKEHTPEQVAHIAESIKRFGLVQPIVIDPDGVIVIGHGRWLAAQQLGMLTATVYIMWNYSQDELRALRIADNKLNADTGFDVANLAFEMEALIGSGYDVGSLNLSFDMNALLGTPDGETKRDEDKDTTRTTKLETFTNNNVRQIVLLLEGDAFDKVLRSLRNIMNATGLETNTECFLYLLEQHENASRRAEAKAA